MVYNFFMKSFHCILTKKRQQALHAGKIIIQCNVLHAFGKAAKRIRREKWCDRIKHNQAVGDDPFGKLVHLLLREIRPQF